MSKEELFKSYKGKVLQLFLKNGFKNEGTIIDVKGGFIIINDFTKGERGIEISQIADYTVMRDPQLDNPKVGGKNG